ncbi:MAG: hypothetical protein JSW59_16600 [Phycisphaerales bacterium]|nr:MAG: hypothetical protein JSW59_16600 [Phycisphaerales bacterium]
MKVSNKADAKLKADCNCPTPITAESIFSKIAIETIKTISGRRKAKTTFLTIEGPSILHNCSYTFPQSCL